jgi:SOS-response transcriptional repressor LexA
MQRKIIPLMPAAEAGAGDCAGAEPVALMVLGDSMLPEFAEGEIVVIEPEGLARDGAFVVAFHEGEPILRQLRAREGGWLLHPLNPRYPDAALADLAAVKGVVIQKSRPGSRRSRKSYVD